MKKRRGRPKGKSYPEPQTSAEGFDIALYGKLGASEAMSFLRDCPYPTIDFIKKKVPKTRDRVDKKFLKFAPKIAQGWLRRISPILAKKIAAGDGEFFRQLGIAVEKFPQIARINRRSLAIECKLYCNATGTPFTCKALHDYYKSHDPEHRIDSSTLSKIRRWARSLKSSDEDLIQDLGPPRNLRPARKSIL